MNASPRLLHSVLPSSVGLRAEIPADHPSADILGTERMGSGTIVDSMGIVLTVNYVALGARAIEVTLLDGTHASGRLIAQDFYSGLAAIKIAGGRYPYAAWSSADQLQTGQEVFLLASAGGAQRRANNGCISSLDEFDAFWEFHLERAIVTTAMNPGVGGGGLFDADGKLVGIVALDLNEVGRFTLAVPVDHYFAHSEELLRYGKRISRPPRAWIGLYCYMLREHIVIAGVLPGAPGERGGLRPGDVVLAVDGAPVSVRHDLYQRVWRHQPGEVIRFQVFRDNAIIDVAVEGGDAEQFFS